METTEGTILATAGNVIKNFTKITEEQEEELVEKVHTNNTTVERINALTGKNSSKDFINNTKGQEENLFEIVETKNMTAEKVFNGNLTPNSNGNVTEETNGDLQDLIKCNTTNSYKCDNSTSITVSEFELPLEVTGEEHLNEGNNSDNQSIDNVAIDLRHF